MINILDNYLKKTERTTYNRYLKLNYILMN